ncbi:pentapeptide repeat-containing protein [Stackebrandtia nassauensis]|nr:pentapeptide repeat-containing protein [Stackebrandtia nassauensis]
MVGIVVAIAVAVGVSWVLLKPGDIEDERARIAAVQAVAAIGFGVGGLGTLLLFVRRQWHQERIAADDRREADRQHERELAKAADDRHDATERRITELYMTAAEQLGHDKAPVRLAALHALDRLGQNEANHRQVIVDIWCSYLRQPFTPPARFVAADDAEPKAAPDEDHPGLSLETEADPADLEYEVRATAQRLLISHLKDPRDDDDRTDEPPPVKPDGFWNPSRIDLTGATLINANFTSCWLPTTTFTRTRFLGRAWFSGARFYGARLYGGAVFEEARFEGGAWFSGVRFDGDANFGMARFEGRASFSRAQFGQLAWFARAQFDGDTRFTDARFDGDTRFTKARFEGSVSFSRAQFGQNAWFDKTRFDEIAAFDQAWFDGDTRFTKARFAGDAGFIRVQFTEDSRFDGVIAVLPSAEGHTHVWPAGWVLEPDPEGPTDWGRLVQEPTPTEPEPDSPTAAP